MFGRSCSDIKGELEIMRFGMNRTGRRFFSGSVEDMVHLTCEVKKLRNQLIIIFASFHRLRPEWTMVFDGSNRS